MYKIRDILKNKDYNTISAREFQYLIGFLLEKQGYSIRYEYPVLNRGDKKKGRIDIVAYKDNKSIGIEADFKSPRKKSIFKLENNYFDEKYIILRSPFSVITI